MVKKLSPEEAMRLLSAQAQELNMGYFDAEWMELDNAARANLGDSGMYEFNRYKLRLKLEGHQWENDARDILTGYIWDESEDHQE